MKKAFEQIPCQGYLTFKLFGELLSETLPEFEKLVQKAIEESAAPPDIIIQCENVSDLSQTWFKYLATLSRSQKSKNKQIRLVQASAKLKTQIRDLGLDQSLPIASSLRQALVDFGIVTAKALDVNFINPFLEATMRVLKIQAGIDAKPGKLYRKDETEQGFIGDISGVIGLVSDVFNGAVVVTFPEQTFLKIMSKMLGENFTSITKDIQDGAAEMTNMIFGQAKISLNEKGYGIQTAIPSVVLGKDHSVQTLTSGPQVVVPFETEMGGFFVEICTN